MQLLVLQHGISINPRKAAKSALAALKGERAPVMAVQAAAAVVIARTDMINGASNFGSTVLMYTLDSMGINGII